MGILSGLFFFFGREISSFVIANHFFSHKNFSIVKEKKQKHRINSRPFPFCSVYFCLDKKRERERVSSFFLFFEFTVCLNYFDFFFRTFFELCE